MSYQLALVTGASSGIGEAVCELLAEKGISLIMTGRDEKRLAEGKSKLQSQVSVQTYSLNLSQPEERRKLIRIIHEQAPDLVINNAGCGLYGEVLTYSLDEQMNIFKLNAEAVLELTIEAARALVSNNKKGTILNVSSAASFYDFPEFAVYASSKAFVNQFSKSFDFEMQPYGIRVLSFCPGMVATRFKERAEGGYSEDKNENRWGVMTAQFAAQKLFEQIQTGQRLKIVDWRYCFSTVLSYLLPKQWLARRLQKSIQSRIPPRNLIKINL